MVQPVAERVVRHRRRAAVAGTRRVEVAVPAGDAALIREAAAVLRHGGAAAEAIRAAIRPAGAVAPARSGAELVAFLRASPLVGIELDVRRDPSPGRPIEIG